MRPLLLAMILVVAACASAEEATLEPPNRLPLVGAEYPEPTERIEAEGGASDRSGQTPPAAELSLWQASGPPSQYWLMPADDEDGTASDSATPSPAPAAPKAPKPQTPTAAPPPPVDVMALYTGVLGTYSLNQVLATTSAPMPTVAPGTAPLTGVSGTASSRPAVVVKVDNSAKARPQSGLNLADVVIEQEVEAGITRLAAIFHSNRVPVVGPVRSARSTDISFLSSLGQPALVYSGANDVFDQLILNQELVQNFSAARSGAYWRDRSRRAPANLYTDTRNFDGSGAPPGAWFQYSPAPTGGTPTSSAIVNFPNATIGWSWDGTQWLRTQDGRVHTTDGGAQVRAINVVVAEVAVVNSGLVDPAGSPVPEFVWAGTGRVVVFTNGQRFDGTWTRPTLADPAVLVDGAGNVISLAPGNTWVQLVRSL